jgi:hypothetical protein
MRSKAWLAASVWLRLPRLPPPAIRVRCSRHLRDTLAAASGLLAHASVTEIVKFSPMGPKLRCNAVSHKQARAQQMSMHIRTAMYLSAGPIRQSLLFLLPKRAREGLAQPQACRAGDVTHVSAARPHPAWRCLQGAAGELAAATCLRQARPLSAPIRFSQMGPKLRYTAGL